MSRGSTGRGVRALQQALVDAGYELDVDGEFGADTEAAVRRFQRANELDVDGIAGEDTLGALGLEWEAKEGEEDEGDEDELPTLERGAQGEAVVALQQALVEAGHAIDVDGDFGADTEAAVRRFQRANELEVDGIVGPETWEALGFEAGDDEEEGGDEEEDAYPTLERGSRGESVVALQQALVEAGHAIDVDGDFGADTEAAVRRFQRTNELEVDGIVGPETWEALGFE